MNEDLMRVVVDVIDFLANCDDEVLDPDTAVAMLEDIGFQINRLSVEDKKIFCSYLEELANETEDKEKAAFYIAMPESLGLQL